MKIKVGQIIKTRFGWFATILEIDYRLLQFGQGIDVIRHEDMTFFSISPDDILY